LNALLQVNAPLLEFESQEGGLMVESFETFAAIDSRTGLKPKPQCEQVNEICLGEMVDELQVEDCPI
jgi:hypothetical protein